MINNIHFQLLLIILGRVDPTRHDPGLGRVGSGHEALGQGRVGSQNVDPRSSLLCSTGEIAAGSDQEATRTAKSSAAP